MPRHIQQQSYSGIHQRVPRGTPQSMARPRQRCKCIRPVDGNKCQHRARRTFGGQVSVRLRVLLSRKAPPHPDLQVLGCGIGPIGCTGRGEGVQARTRPAFTSIPTATFRRRHQSPRQSNNSGYRRSQGHQPRTTLALLSDCHMEYVQGN